MALVKITNGTNIFEVTRGAFDGIYSKQGFSMMKEKTGKADAEPVTPSEPEKTEDEKFVEELNEKPLSQWNKEEVKHFATIKEIDISGTKNANEAKEIIKQFLEQ